MREFTEVAAALIFRKGRFLICQRPANKARGLMWELAGGKAERGETLQDALVRELREELGIDAVPLERFFVTQYVYPDISVRLTVFTAEIVSGEPENLEHAAIKWIYPSEAKYYDFCPADRPVLQKISEEFSGRKPRHNRDEGVAGEKRAARYLARRGYKITERNLRTPFGEVDIVAERKDVLAFCEVKTRLGSGYGAPSEAVDEARRKRYINSAAYYIKDLAKEYVVRFDVIEVTGRKVNHIINAFES